jgi:hypothetical protein
MPAETIVSAAAQLLDMLVASALSAQADLSSRYHLKDNQAG